MAEILHVPRWRRFLLSETWSPWSSMKPAKQKHLLRHCNAGEQLPGTELFFWVSHIDNSRYRDGSPRATGLAGGNNTKTLRKWPSELSDTQAFGCRYPKQPVGEIKENMKWKWKAITSVSYWKARNILCHVTLLKDLIPRMWTCQPVHSQTSPSITGFLLP